MKIITKDISFFQISLQGYFVAKKYFRGKFYREVFLTFFDKKTRKSYFGYLYITTSNVLLVVKNTTYSQQPNWIYEIDSTDKVDVITDANKYLREIINATMLGEKNLEVATTQPLSLIELNNRYFLLSNYQVDLNFTGKQINLESIWILPKDYQEKVTNLAHLLINPKTRGNVLLPGMNKYVALINIFAGGLTLLTILLILLFLLLKAMHYL